MNFGSFSLPSSPVVMGVLNLTPEATDGATYLSIEAAIARGEQMLTEGVALIGVGGESNRSGTEKISLQQELDRVIPVIEVLSKRVSVPISIDTSTPEIMEAAINAGAKIINDARALTKPGAQAMAAKLGVTVCLMHMQNDPVTMQIAPSTHDIVSEVFQYLDRRIKACIAEGVDPHKIIIDPGFGFGKNLQNNLSILRSLEIFTKLQKPLLVGMSNKSMIGQILDVGIDQRVYGSLAAAVIAAGKGANIIRAHNVQATVDAIKVFTTVAGI